MRDQTSPFYFAIHAPTAVFGRAPDEALSAQLRLYLHNHVSRGMNVTLLMLRNRLLQVSYSKYISWAWGAFPAYMTDTPFRILLRIVRNITPPVISLRSSLPLVYALSGSARDPSPLCSPLPQPASHPSATTSVVPLYSLPSAHPALVAYASKWITRQR
jgi:hypothetical protein